MITVERMAGILQSDGIKLIAGKGGSNLQIDYVNVQELNLKSDWFQKNGFILTTFNAFMNIDEILERLNWFKKIGISAVGFNVAVFKEIPKQVIDRADQLQLPLFLIPSNKPYYLVFERFNALLAAETNQIREDIQNINKNMLEAVVMEKDSHHIVQMIGKYLNVPVCYLDESLDVLSYWHGSDFSKMGILNLIEKQVTKDIEIFLESSLSKTMGESSTFIIEENKISFTVIALLREKDLYGYLLIGIPKEKVLLNEVIIKHGVTTLIIDAIRRKAVSKYQKNKDILLFESIFKNEIHTPINLDSFSSNVTQIKFLFVAESKNGPVTNEMFDFFYRVLTHWDSRCFVWLFENKIVGVSFQSIPVSVLDKLTNITPQITVGISKKVSKFQTKEIRKMYNQALISCQISRGNEKQINYWDELGVNKLIYVSSRDLLFEDYDLDILNPLLQDDEQTGGELAKTFYIYLQTFFSLKDSAERLFVHANTVKYRIEKVREIYKGIVFNDPNNYLLFMTAFKIYYMKNETKV